MISTHNVSLRYGDRALFEDVSVKFTEGNCYGIIGANGAGKSTFLKILSGEIEPNKGEVIIEPNKRLSVLKQDHFAYDDNKVVETVIMGNKRLFEIMQEKEKLYAKADFNDEDGIRLGELEGEFADMDGWNAESDAEIMLNGLGIVLSPESNPGFLPGMNAGAFNLGAGLSFAILPAVLMMNSVDNQPTTDAYFQSILVGLIITVVALVASFSIPRPKNAEL